MNRVFRPKLSGSSFPAVLAAVPPLIPLLAPLVLATPARAQAPVSSTYATRDGRNVSTVLACGTTDGSFTAQPCGVAGYPLHVQVDGGVGGSGAAPATPTTAPGTPSSQLVGVQGGGAGALPVAVSQSGTWTLALPNGAHLALDAGGNVIGAVTQGGAWSVAVSNLPSTQAVSAASLPLPAGAATAANQPVRNADGGSQVHVMNLPATQAVSAAALPLPAGAATAANQPALNGDGGALVHLANALPAGANTIGTVVAANRSGAWTDASTTATASAATPTGLAAVAARTGLHVWNLGTATACLNYTAAAVASGTGCAAGSVPIPAGSAYLEDQPGNVSPEAISLVCAAATCPLTIKVR